MSRIRLEVGRLLARPGHGPARRDAAIVVEDGRIRGIETVTPSADGARLLVFTNTARVWRQHTRGDYWVLDRASGKLQQLGIGARPSTLMFAKFAPDNLSVAYVFANNIYVETLANNQITQLTHDGSDHCIKV